MKDVSLNYFKEWLLEIDPGLATADKDTYNTALVILSALDCGPEATRLSDFTGVSEEVVHTIRKRMLKAELWTSSKVLCDHWFTKEHLFRPIIFSADVLVARGILVRKWCAKENVYRRSLAKSA